MGGHHNHITPMLLRVGEDFVRRLTKADGAHRLKACRAQPGSHLAQVVLQLGSNALSFLRLVYQVIAIDVDRIEVNHCQPLVFQHRSNRYEMDLGLAAHGNGLGVGESLFGEGRTIQWDDNLMVHRWPLQGLTR